MIVLLFGLGLTVVFLGKLGYWGKHYAADLGSMSHQWLEAHRASQQAWSF